MSDLEPQIQPLKSEPSLIIFEKKSIDSTQSEAKRLLDHSWDSPTPPYVIITSEQTNGRGRAGREWFTPQEKNITFSLVVEIPKKWQEHCTLLSPLITFSIKEQIQEWGVPLAKIKWPNDIVVSLQDESTLSHQKMCGILVESFSDTNHAPRAIIGVGINVNLSQEECLKLSTKSARKTTSLLVETSRVWNIEKAALQIIHRILSDLKNDALTPESLLIRWNKECSWMISSQVTTHAPDGTLLSGIVQGFSPTGALLLLNDQTSSINSITWGLD